MRRALLSVYDKTGIVEFAKNLFELNFEIISTGGTYNLLKKEGIAVKNISEITGFPECLDGRVKTLHPNVHAGILAMRNNHVHMEQLHNLNVLPIDVVAVNLYPFKETIMRENTEFAEAVENIDIGGPTMLRAAAKNYQDVFVAVDTTDYSRIIEAIKNKNNAIDLKKELMQKVYSHTAAYDAMIAQYLNEQLNIEYPEKLTITFEKCCNLRYGENPHQTAAMYKNPVSHIPSLTDCLQLNGKELSYNNLNDANGAIELLKEFDLPTAVAVKHANPCGVASADDILTAYLKAYNSDPVSIFGGIVALNRKVESDIAIELTKIFLEIIIAPDFSDDALEILRKKKNLRVLKINIENKHPNKQFKQITDGLIIQSNDDNLIDEMKVVTTKLPNENQKIDMLFGMKVVKHCKSNAIVIVKDNVTLGLGIGQTNRIWATQQAIEHSINGVQDAVLVSDAFFPFRDCVDEAIAHGVSAIMHPGGSKNDEESIRAAEEGNIIMVLSGVRHFKH